MRLMLLFFFFQAEDGIRDLTVTGVQTCALPISAARSLGHLGDPRAVLPLINVLADSDGEVRTAAVEALADLADPRAIGSIAGLLKDPVADVKRNALGALSHFDQAVQIGRAHV